MRNMFYGLIVGIMLSALRAPLGIDLLQMPAVEAGTAYGYRSLALVLIAMAWWLKAEGRVSIGFLASTVLGFALHALWLTGVWSPASAAWLWITGLLGVACLVWLGRGDMLNEREPAADRPSYLGMLGLCAAGAGVAVALESVARHVRLFGGGLPADDSSSAIVLLACTTLGAIACGWIAASQRLRSISFPVGLAAAATACFVSLQMLNRLATTRGISQFLQTYGLDTSSHGMLAYDVLIAAACFLVPAFVIGATLRGARSKLDLTSALFGAALGIYFVPRLMTTPEHRSVGELEMFSAQLVPFGCLTAIGGAALTLLATASLGAVARWSAIAFTLFLCIAPLEIAVSPKIVIAPWMVVPPRQTLVCDSPEGLVTVEPSDGGLMIATLDRHALTPATEAAVADVERIKLAIAMVPPERWAHASSAAQPNTLPPNVPGPNAADSGAHGTLKVLLIGQHTPVRAQAFKDAGVERVDRSAAWFGSMKRLDDALFDKLPAPLGDRLSPDEARQKIAAGDYDLVIVEPVPGAAPVTKHLSVPDKTTLVAWFSPEQWIVQRNLGSAVLFSTEGIDDPCVGVVLNGARAPLVNGEPPLFVAAGEPMSIPLPLAQLDMHDSERFDQRTIWCRASLARRLADAARGGPNEKLMQAFALLYASQSQRAEFETKEERIELPQESLALFEEIALSGQRTAYVRSVWESLARVLLGKRAVADIYKYLQPLADKYRPWPVLEQVLAQADLESLEPEAAARRLSGLIAARARENDGAENVMASSARGEDNAGAREKDLELWYWLGEAQRRSGDHPAASRSWRRALELQPENRALKRQLAMELVRASDPDGRKMIDELLAEKPDDAELAVFQTPGPYPEPAAEPAPKNGKKHHATGDGH